MRFNTMGSRAQCKYPEKRDRTTEFEYLLDLALANLHPDRIVEAIGAYIDDLYDTDRENGGTEHCDDFIDQVESLTQDARHKIEENYKC